jgi:hypothetical protein
MKKVIGFIIAVIILAVFFFKETSNQEKPKVYDCFLFFNEFELLKIRLDEMSPYVDKFVLVEAEETFRGDPKPLYFAENSHLFEEYKDKIIHIVVSGHYEDDARFHRERHQRNQILKGLAECKKSDIIMISDVDEIVRGTDIPKIVELLTSKKASAVLCYQKMYMFYLNRYTSPWPGTAATTFKKLKSTYGSMPDMVRRRRSKVHAAQIENCGWHFSYMGGVEQMMKKISAFSHFEIDTPEHRKSFIEQFQAEHPLEQIDATFPAYILEHYDDLMAKGYLDK